jgi:hypothetical protein
MAHFVDKKAASLTNVHWEHVHDAGVALLRSGARLVSSLLVGCALVPCVLLLSGIGTGGVPARGSQGGG